MKRAITVAAFVALTVAVAGGPVSAQPAVGYVYPAGGQQGTTFTVEVGGQRLGDVDRVHISGEGVQASVVEHVRELEREELRDAKRFLRDLVSRRWSARVMDQYADTDEPPLPDHPWLRNLDEKTPGELARLRTALFDPKKQPNDQIAEQVVVEVSIAPDATPGDRELRLVSPGGLSNPLCFQVGTLREMREREFEITDNPAAQVVEPPVLLNGQITPGEVDHVRLLLREGQRLVVDLSARRLVPYLADAVPGWFQATLALYDPDGDEVAYVDDFRFDPDPVLLHEVAEDGVYRLKIQDALFRGREDFVYRIAVGELPFVTSMFPLGGREGSSTVASLEGWNLPADTFELDTASSTPMRRVTVDPSGGLTGEVRYAVDTLFEVVEEEPNNEEGEAQYVPFPHIVNGRIGSAGDVDIFSFEGHAGQSIVAEIHARRLDSPLDSVLELRGPDGERVALSDDWEDPERGLMTHHADSRIEAELPADGTYRVAVADARRHGGEAHAYRLHLRAQQADFALRLVPSALNVRAGGSVTAEVHALRQEGFAGEITLALTDAPEGFTMPEAAISADEDKIEVTLKAPREAPRLIEPIHVEGSAQIDGETVTRPAVPAEDMMQAFLWRFLVPRDELLVAITGSEPVPAVWRPLVPGVELAGDGPVRIPLGGTASVTLQVPATLPDDRGTSRDAMRYRMCNRPRGVTLVSARTTDDGVLLTLKADRNMCLPGDSAHVIVEAFVDGQADGGAGDATAGGRVELGVLPAIPFEIVHQQNDIAVQRGM